MRLPHGGRFFDLMPSKRVDEFSTPHRPESEWAFVDTLDEAYLRHEEQKARALYESSERAIVASPPAAAPPCG